MFCPFIRTKCQISTKNQYLYIYIKKPMSDSLNLPEETAVCSEQSEFLCGCMLSVHVCFRAILQGWFCSPDARAAGPIDSYSTEASLSCQIHKLLLNHSEIPFSKLKRHSEVRVPAFQSFSASSLESYCEVKSSH